VCVCVCVCVCVSVCMFTMFVYISGHTLCFLIALSPCSSHLGASVSDDTYTSVKQRINGLN
jgi:hypothetical protein